MVYEVVSTEAAVSTEAVGVHTEVVGFRGGAYVIA